MSRCAGRAARLAPPLIFLPGPVLDISVEVINLAPISGFSRKLTL